MRLNPNSLYNKWIRNTSTLDLTVQNQKKENTKMNDSVTIKFFVPNTWTISTNFINLPIREHTLHESNRILYSLANFFTITRLLRCRDYLIFDVTSRCRCDVSILGDHLATSHIFMP